MPQVRKYVKKSDKEAAPKGGRTCNIKGCNAPAVRSLSIQQYEQYLKDLKLELVSSKERKLRPCESHYKMLKKKKKKDDKINKAIFEARTSGKG